MLWLLKLTAPLVLAIREGRVALAKGRLPASKLRELQGLLQENSIRRGTIHTDATGRIHFSLSIPADLHQRLRNVITC